MDIYYLYVKTHLITGLKYLGYTTKNPYEYRGSGKYWIRHIHKHSNDVWTNIIFQTEDKSELSLIGLYYSDFWNIVFSKEWANMKPESGSGGTWNGLHGADNPMYGTKRPQSVKDAISKANTGKKNVFLSEFNKKKRWWTNGSVDKCQTECPPGFYLGRSKMLGKNNPVYTRFSISS